MREREREREERRETKLVVVGGKKRKAARRGNCVCVKQDGRFNAEDENEPAMDG
jgi:hypothetical protein